MICFLLFTIGSNQTEFLNNFVTVGLIDNVVEQKNVCW